MVGYKGLLAGVVAALVATVGIQSTFAAPTVAIISDTGTLKTDFLAPPASQSTNSLPSPYGSGAVTITPVLSGPTTIGYKLTFAPNSGFFASANNLAGGKSSTFAGVLAFDITFDSAVKLTTNIFEDGIYSVSGQNSRVAVVGDALSGVVISQQDNILAPESLTSVFKTSAVISPIPNPVNSTFPSGSGAWSLYNQTTGFSKNYQKYRIVVDNDLLAEALLNPQQAPGFAAIAKKDFSIVFTFDGSSGGGPIVPEPASLGVLALGGLALLARRRK